MNTGEMMAVISSSLTSFVFLYMMIQQYFPSRLAAYFETYTHRIIGYFNPYMQITIYELSGEKLKKSEAYTKIQAYLSATESSKEVKKLKADVSKDSKKLAITMDDNGEIPDEYQGVKLWWSTRKRPLEAKPFSIYPTTTDEKRYLTLKFHKRNRDLVTNMYLNHAMEEGKSIGLQNRQRKLYTNNPSSEWYGWKSSVWSHVVFDHPANFDTLAMDPVKKKEIMDDLVTFSKGKEYYKKIGKAWKRGYLLYGPPGTGKSTMIAAMANFLNYDIYDLELTTVKGNSELRKLLIETSNKSIIVIEDIDCSLELTGQRKKVEENDDDDEEKDPVKKAIKEKEDVKESKITLSGLLNFIDGLWSACGGERLIVFTTNYVEKLDPALIRRGRMDKHIELSYCGFEGFKVLAKNYLDMESHDLFETIRGLIEENQMTPADVAENLMPKTVGKDAETNCLVSLIQALENAKEEAKLKKKAEEEAASELEKKKKAKEEAADRESASKNETKLKESTQIEKEKAKQNESTQLVIEKETSEKEHVNKD